MRMVRLKGLRHSKQKPDDFLQMVTTHWHMSTAKGTRILRMPLSP